jgi:alkylated DNA repair dioxygenase AlkB
VASGVAAVHEGIAVLPDQLIINNYEPGQGIAPHVDHEGFFQDGIVSISLLSPVVMEFIHTETKERLELLLEAGSALSLSGEARHLWKHGIRKRLTDRVGEEVIRRERRVSLTFRGMREGFRRKEE